MQHILRGSLTLIDPGQATFLQVILLVLAGVLSNNELLITNELLVQFFLNLNQM